MLAVAVALAAVGQTTPATGSAAVLGSVDRPGALSALDAYSSETFLLVSNDRQQAPPARNRLRTKARIENVNITFYDCADQGFCEHMYNGRRVYQGAAACSWNLDIGTKFFIVGDPTRRLYMCEDRGLLDDTWVDIFWYFPSDGWAWQSGVGRFGTIEIVE
jgi:hypothetical protein